MYTESLRFLWAVSYLRRFDAECTVHHLECTDCNPDRQARAEVAHAHDASGSLDKTVNRSIASPANNRCQPAVGRRAALNTAPRRKKSKSALDCGD